MNSPAQFILNGPLILASVRLTYWMLWGGSLALSVTFITLLWTRWGHSRPLQKCAALSLIVHLILAFLTMTVRIVSGDGPGHGTGGGGGDGGPIHVRVVEEGPPLTTKLLATSTESTPEIAAPALLTPPPPPKVEEPKPAAVVEKAPKKIEPAPVVAAAAAAKQIVEPKATKEQPLATAKSEPHQSPTAAAPVAATSKAPPATVAAAAVVAAVTSAHVSSAYALRNSPGRLGLVAGQGGNKQTEAAVAAALRWLAAAQSRDGRWDAVQFGAGNEELVLGQNRGGAGRNADTGITALALLAFLGAGHSHVQGEYQDNVRRGLDFLLRSQAADGSLFGEATLYAQMYCHSMSTFALAEAQALTGDRRLAAAVTKAVNFSLAAQNTTTGGWRYRPGDTGDTSQLGWQIMALTSAERAGIDVPDQTWNRVERFLQGVRRGPSGGLASYRPDSPMSTSMTAEALYCRLMLQETMDVTLSESAANEATSQLLASPPNTERMNLYYWYYATLALHQRENSGSEAAAAWRTWNDAMTSVLTKTQVASGSEAGSWESNTIWGGYGGRVYTTAMATMCLEVYYRYAPVAERGNPMTASRAQSAPR